MLQLQKTPTGVEESTHPSFSGMKVGMEPSPPPNVEVPGMTLTSFPLHVPEGQFSTFQTHGDRVFECRARARSTR